MSGSAWNGARLLTTTVALCSLACATNGCDPSITSVGAWEPVMQQGGAAGEASGGPGLYLEAEDGELTGGFSIVADVAASNGQYIQPPTGPALEEAPVADSPRARYTFDLANPGDYVIWGRIYSPDVSSNRFWFQVDGGAWHVWRITVGEIWFWDDFHIDTNYDDTQHFMLAAGPHELVIAKDASSARLDRLYITAEGDEPPGNDTPCNPPHTIDRGGGVCAPSCGSLAPAGMHTSCMASVCAGKETLEVYDCNICCVVP